MTNKKPAPAKPGRVFFLDQKIETTFFDHILDFARLFISPVVNRMTSDEVIRADFIASALVSHLRLTDSVIVVCVSFLVVPMHLGGYDLQSLTLALRLIPAIDNSL